MAETDPLPDDTGDGLADSEDVLDFSESAGDEGGVVDDLFDFDEILADNDAPAEVDLDEILADLPEETVIEASREPSAPEVAIGAAAPASSRSHAAPDLAQAEEAEPGTSRSRIPSRTGLLLVAFTLLNLVLIGFTWKMSKDVRTRVDAATVDILRASRDIKQHAGEQVEMIESVQAPIVSPEPEGSETFRRARADLEAGDHESARRRLYALLAISGRLNEDLREDVVAHARFMLADTLFEQALGTEASGSPDGGTP